MRSRCLLERTTSPGSGRAGTGSGAPGTTRTCDLQVRKMGVGKRNPLKPRDVADLQPTKAGRFVAFRAGLPPAVPPPRGCLTSSRPRLSARPRDARRHARTTPDAVALLLAARSQIALRFEEFPGAQQSREVTEEGWQCSATARVTRGRNSAMIRWETQPRVVTSPVAALAAVYARRPGGEAGRRHD